MLLPLLLGCGHAAHWARHAATAMLSVFCTPLGSTCCYSHAAAITTGVIAPTSPPTHTQVRGMAASLSSAKDVSEAELGALRVRAEAADTKAAELEAQLYQVQGQAGVADSRVAELTKQLSEVQGQAGVADSRVAELTKQLSEVQGQVGVADSRVAELTKQLSDVQGQAGVADSRVAELTKQLFQVQGQAGVADSRVAELTKQLSEVQGQATTARQQVEDMAAMYAEGNRMRGEDQARLRAQLRDLEVRVGGQSSSGRGSWILSQIMDPG